MIIIADSDNDLFNTKDQLAKRHNHKAIGITKLDKIVNVTEENVVMIDGEDIVDVGMQVDTETPDEESDIITICHKPGTTAEKTMTIPMSALKGHLGHGDYTGACVGR